jgi:hypothetical protein
LRVLHVLRARRVLHVLALSGFGQGVQVHAWEMCPYHGNWKCGKRLLKSHHSGR